MIYIASHPTHPRVMTDYAIEEVVFSLFKELEALSIPAKIVPRYMLSHPGTEEFINMKNDAVWLMFELSGPTVGDLNLRLASNDVGKSLGEGVSKAVGTTCGDMNNSIYKDTPFIQLSLGTSDVPNMTNIALAFAELFKNHQ